MPVTLHVGLFGKPGWELEEGGEVTPQQLRDLAEDLHGRLQRAADVIEKLTNAGWEAQMLLYDICLSHPYIHTAAEAEERLERLGIDPSGVAIDEWPDEEEEFDVDEPGEAELD